MIRFNLSNAKKNIPALAFILGLGIISFIFSVVVISSIVFCLHGQVQLRWLFLGTALTIAAVLYITRTYGILTRVATLLSLFLVIGASIGLASISLDSSYDGNSYHKIAIGELKNGWNPVYESVNVFNRSAENPYKIIDVTGVDRANDYLWADTYPKTTWIFAANMYKLTGNIESGKAINILVLVAVLLMAFSYLFRWLGMQKAFFVALLLAFNPVAVSQIAGYFNDGAMGNMLLLLLILLTVLVDKTTRLVDRRILYTAIGLTLIITINTKFTGLAYAGIICICYWLYYAIHKQWSVVRNLTIVGTAALIFGLGIVGSSSYINNMRHYHHPLFPLFGKDKRDIMTHNQPASYVDKAGIVKLFEANFSHTGNILRDSSIQSGEPTLKVPFVITPEEVTSMGSSPDIRQAGYGVWFSGILLFTLVVGIYLIKKYARRDIETFWIAALPILAVLVTAIAFDNSWWARYLPHLYAVPVIVLVVLLVTKRRTLASILGFMLAFNIILLSSMVATYQIRYTRAYDNNLSVNLICGEQPTYVQGQGSLSGAMYNLWDRCENVTPLSGPPIDISNPHKAIPLMTDIYRVL